MSASEQVAVHGAGERQPAPEQAAALPGSADGRLLASRPLDGLRQIGIGLGIWAGYLLITRSVSVGLGSADARGRALLRFERWLHVDIESACNRWLVHQPVLGWLAAWEYATTYIATTFAVLGWLWWRRPRSYRWGRNVLAISTMLALGCFWQWPTTPPRLLAGSGFADIVARYHPVLSWGGGAVASSADQYAAMPSLHVGWAVWVTVVSLRAGATRLGYSLATLHLLVTTAVVIATGNHYVLDVAAGGGIVAIAAGEERIRAVAVRRWRSARDGTRVDGSSVDGSSVDGSSVDGSRVDGARVDGTRVAAEDEFFLHVETPTVQQPVGGFVLLDLDRADGELDLARFRRLLAERAPGMPRFDQRLLPATRRRHARWQTVPLDIDQHVLEHRLPAGGGRAALADFVSRLTELELEYDRPLWRLWFVPDVGDRQAAAVAIMHHAIADGLGVVDILRQLFEPPLPPPDLSGAHRPGRAMHAGLAVVGIGQLAIDGRADPLPYSGRLSGRRTFRCALTPLDPVLELARHTGTRVTDVLLAATGEALAQGECRGSIRQRLRAAVPVTTRLPAPPGTGRAAQPGNLTAAVRLDVPLAGMAPLARLGAVHGLAEGRRRSARPFGAAAVIRLLGLLPPFLHRLAARGVYRGRHFTAIVSNMPGPSVPLSLAGAPIQDVYPILPLAERVPLAVGSLGWAGQFCVSITADAERLPAADTLAQRIVEAIEKMQADAGLINSDRAVG
jgi:diacylglycerol O-acyltransferase / wax synthase